MVWLAGSWIAFTRYVMMPSRADGLMLGVLIAWAIRDDRWKTLLIKMRFAIQSATVLLAGGLTALCIRVNPSFVWVPWLHSSLAFFYSALLLLAITGRGLVSWLFRRASLRKLGLLAYGIYLLHEPVSWLTTHVVLGGNPAFSDPPSVVVTMFAALLTYVIAAASWRFFEKPLVAIGQRVSYGQARSACGDRDQDSTTADTRAVPMDATAALP